MTTYHIDPQNKTEQFKQTAQLSSTLASFNSLMIHSINWMQLTCCQTNASREQSVNV